MVVWKVGNVYQGQLATTGPTQKFIYVDKHKNPPGEVITHRHFFWEATDKKVYENYGLICMTTHHYNALTRTGETVAIDIAKWEELINDNDHRDPCAKFVGLEPKWKQDSAPAGTATAGAASGSTPPGTTTTATTSKVNTKILESPPDFSKKKSLKAYKEELKDYLQLTKDFAIEEVKYFIGVRGGLPGHVWEEAKKKLTIGELLASIVKDISPSEFELLSEPLRDLWSTQGIYAATSPQEWVNNMKKIRREMSDMGMIYNERSYGVLLLFLANLQEVHSAPVLSCLTSYDAAEVEKALLQVVQSTEQGSKSTTVLQVSTNNGNAGYNKKKPEKKQKHKCKYCMPTSG